MINYLKALNMKQAPPLTPYYAQLESNRHPGWPTHILWAQLMSKVILFVLQNSSFDLSSSNNNNNNDNNNNQLIMPPITSYSSTKYGLCFQVSSYL